MNDMNHQMQVMNLGESQVGDIQFGGVQMAQGNGMQMMNIGGMQMNGMQIGGIQMAQGNGTNAGGQGQYQNNQTTNTASTASTSTSTVGGQARQAAAAKGQQELQRFDQSVQEMLINASASQCPSGAKYYHVKDGYLCGIGNHFISDRDVDNMINHGTQPYIEKVNSILHDELRWVAPPADGWHEPFHWDPETRHARGLAVMQIKWDGSEWDLSDWEEDIY